METECTRAGMPPPTLCAVRRASWKASKGREAAYAGDAPRGLMWALS